MHILRAFLCSKDWIVSGVIIFIYNVSLYDYNVQRRIRSANVNMNPAV